MRRIAIEGSGCVVAEGHGLLRLYIGVATKRIVEDNAVADLCFISLVARTALDSVAFSMLHLLLMTLILIGIASCASTLLGGLFALKSKYQMQFIFEF